MKKKSLLLLLTCYLIWGLQPLYWALLDEFSPIFILCTRIVMSVVFTYAFLIFTGRFKEIINTFKDLATMKYLAPAAVFLCADWGIFIWAISSQHLLDATIGYYMNPLVIFLMGVFLFKERAHVLEVVAVALACIGIVISTAQQGVFPVASIPFALCWPIYASIKKGASADPIVSIAVETTVLLPFALAYIIFGCRGADGLGLVNLQNTPILIFSGLVTALPMILYTQVVNDMPFKLVGIMQYAGTTLTFFCSVLFLDEKITSSKLIMFAFIWAGLIVFTIGNFRKQKAEIPEID